MIKAIEQFKSKYQYSFLALVLVSIFLIDRYFWAGLSQWREDQATNLWLGYVRPIMSSPVGLISSIGTPNPNGMLIFTRIMSLLPSILSLGIALSIAQAALIFYFLASLNFQRSHLWLALSVFLTSVVMRAIGPETWQTVAIMNLSMIYFSLLMRFLKKPSPYNLFGQAVCLILFPAIYLSGICNSITGTLMTLFVLSRKKNNWPAKVWGLLVVSIALFAIAMAIVTWAPFIKNLDFATLSSPDNNAKTMFQRLKRVAGVFFYLPEWIHLFSKNGFTPISQYDLRVFSTLSRLLSSMHGWVMYLLSNLVLIINAKLCFDKIKKKDIEIESPFYIFSFLILMLSVNVLLGNWRWHRGERLDQSIQFYPFFLALFCHLPAQMKHIFQKQKIYYLANFSLLSFCIINFSAGFSVIKDLTEYRGPIIPSSDISWFDRELATKEIATDAKTKKSNISSVSIEYLMNEPWSWEGPVDHALAKYYPPTYRAGRAMDYELLRRYGIKNEYEGIFKENVPHGQSQYLVAYDVENTLDIEPNYKYLKKFGRIKLLIRD